MTDKKILVVDDDCDFLESLHLMLVNCGHRVMTATNGDDAVDLYVQFGPDIVFVDVRMPGTDGHGTLLKIKRRDRDARVVLMTGHPAENQHKSMANAVGMLTKPVDPSLVNKIINKHAKRS